MILGLKLGRRLLAAVATSDEQIVFQDVRFSPSRRAVVKSGLTGYFERLLEQTLPTAVYYYAPTGPETLTEEIVKSLEAVAGAQGVPVKPLTRLDVFGSFGVLPFRTRQELRDHIGCLWPALGQAKLHQQVPLAEAAAVSLVGDLLQEFPDP